MVVIICRALAHRPNCCHHAFVIECSTPFSSPILSRYDEHFTGVPAFAPQGRRLASQYDTLILPHFIDFCHLTLYTFVARARRCHRFLQFSILFHTPSTILSATTPGTRFSPYWIRLCDRPTFLPASHALAASNAAPKTVIEACRFIELQHYFSMMTAGRVGLDATKVAWSPRCQSSTPRSVSPRRRRACDMRPCYRDAGAPPRSGFRSQLSCRRQMPLPPFNARRA